MDWILVVAVPCVHFYMHLKSMCSVCTTERNSSGQNDSRVNSTKLTYSHTKRRSCFPFLALHFTPLKHFCDETRHNKALLRKGENTPPCCGSIWSHSPQPCRLKRLPSLWKPDPAVCFSLDSYSGVPDLRQWSQSGGIAWCCSLDPLRWNQIV